MRANLEFLDKNFDYFNKLIFNNELPKIPIKLSQGTKVLASVRKKIYKGEVCSRKICFSTRYDLPQNVLEDILIHEMIHLFIDTREIIDSSPHGNMFKEIMNNINRKFQRNIQVRLRLPGQIEASACGDPNHYIILCVYKSRGEELFLRSPKTRALNHYNELTKSISFDSVQLLVTTNPFFNRIPKSINIKLYKVTDEIRANLKDALKLYPRQ